MKKILFVVAAAALTLASCGNKANAPVEAAVDSTEIVAEEANAAADEMVSNLTQVLDGKDVNALQAALEAAKAKVQELVAKKMIRDNALLLSTAAQFNETTAVGILHWLNDTQVLFCSEDEELWKSAISYLDDERLRERMVSFARYADLGIENITKTGNRIVSYHRQYDDDGREVNNVSFAFNKNESDGTIKYFSLAYPIIDALDHGKRVIIDELDSKLHPLLVKKVVALFNDAITNPKGAQLLFTAHDTYLLSAKLFRRDQVWFTQKNNFGATELYSLAEYKVRSNTPFEKDYLLGKYGATPLIGDLENVFRRDGFSSLVRKVASCGLGITTSLVCSCPVSQVRAMNNNAVPAVHQNNVSPKSKTIGLLLNLFLGPADLFYAGKIGQGFLALFTLEGLGLWHVCRLIQWATGGMTDGDGLPITN